MFSFFKMARNIVLEKYYVLQDFLIKIMIPFKKGKKTRPKLDS